MSIKQQLLESIESHFPGVSTADIRDIRELLIQKPPDVISHGSLVEIAYSKEGAKPIHVLILPKGAGTTIQIDATSVTLISPDTPVARALLGKKTGDESTINTPQGSRCITIINTQ